MSLVEVPDSLLREALPPRSYQLWKQLQEHQLAVGVGNAWFLNISTINQNNFCHAVCNMDRGVFRRMFHKWKKHLIAAGLLEKRKHVGGRKRGWWVVVHGQSKIGGTVAVPQATYEMMLAKKEKARQTKATSANLLHRKMSGEIEGNSRLYLAKLVSTDNIDYVKVGVTSRPMDQRWSPVTARKWHNIKATMQPICSFEMSHSEAYKAEQWVLGEMNNLGVVPAMGDETYDLCHLQTLTDLYERVTQIKGDACTEVTLENKKPKGDACTEVTPYNNNILTKYSIGNVGSCGPSDHNATPSPSEVGMRMTKEEWVSQFSDEEGTSACYIKQEDIPRMYKLEAQKFRYWFTNPLRFYSKNGGFRINKVRSPDPPMLDPKLSRDEKVQQLYEWANNAGDYFWGSKTRWYKRSTKLKKDSIDAAIEIFHKYKISPVRWFIAYGRYLTTDGTKFVKKRPPQHLMLCGTSLLTGKTRNNILSKYDYGIEHGIRGLALGQTPILDDLLKRWGNMQIEPLFVRQDLTDRVLAGIVWDYFHADDATPREVIKTLLMKSEMEAKSKQSYINELARDGYNVWEVEGVSDGQD